MRRWHDPRENAIMLRRFKEEMELHGYDWRNPPDPKCDKHICHCAGGIGTMRKDRPNGRCSCSWCKPRYPKNRNNKKREAIAFDLNAN